jgi:hypothetical protein
VSGGVIAGPGVGAAAGEIARAEDVSSQHHVVQTRNMLRGSIDDAVGKSFGQLIRPASVDRDQAGRITHGMQWRVEHLKPNHGLALWRATGVDGGGLVP